MQFVTLGSGCMMLYYYTHLQTGLSSLSAISALAINNQNDQNRDITINQRGMKVVDSNGIIKAKDG